MHYFESKETFKKAFLENLKNYFNKDLEQTNAYERYYVLASLLNESLKDNYEKTTNYIINNNLKKAIYFSMEFLMGRLITNNLFNSGNYDLVEAVFKDLNIDINEIEHMESDAGLGNGGLGRLSACFLDSAASTNLPLFGNSLRYEHGFFTQDIIDYKQVEKQDNWLEKPFIWEERIDSDQIDIPMFGYVEHTKLINPQWIKAVPYDVKVVGDSNNVVTKLRIWKTEPSDKQLIKSDYYMNFVNNITNVLYPDDSTDEGKTLRLMQSYVFSAAGVKSIIKEHKDLNRHVRTLPEYYVFQINDTHPTLVIPELMRILMDEEHLGYDEAWDITKSMVAFTNHTILSEALEKWNINVFRNLLPRIYEILQEMNRRFIIELEADGRFNPEQIYLMKLIGQNNVRMAHISIYGSFSVNGVAALHTEILKNIEMKNFYDLYPNKFNNKTNGITHRRWLIHTNKELTKLLDKYIKGNWRNDLSLFKTLEKYVNDKTFKNELYEVKQAKKLELAERIFELEGVKLDPNSIFSIQIKRLHEYKRQLLNIMHVIYVYERLKEDLEFRKNYVPHSFIFGAKAAPSYQMAKMIIEIINRAAEVINNDNETNDLLKVVFVKNYNVTYAEYLMPAADLSEQISTASKEASGTGNMKFMMNGGLTIGTMDGANVEIVENAGIENAFIFGLSAKEVTDIYKYNNYRPREIFDRDVRLQRIFHFIRNLHPNFHHFDFVLNNLLNSDYFLVLKDFDDYVLAHEKANETYKDQDKWLEMSIYNIANSYFFTSDRTISDYNNEIWKLEKVKF